MKLSVQKRYLIFPVRSTAVYKKLRFFSRENVVYELDIRLDNHDPDFHAALDVSRFMGEELELQVSPEMPLCYQETDERNIPDLYRETLRPQVHFTPQLGWTNDPNGLVYLNGQYHLFFQHNPCDRAWGNMHWGHAISTDLIHWEEQPIALFPDEMGTMFSGSGLLDVHDRLGLASGEMPTAVLFYTAAGNPFTQCMAYSTDGLQTIHKFSGNPILPHVAGCNRDPKVVFCEELDTYLMALYLDGDEYALFTSTDLVHWSEQQRLNLPGCAECPDIFPLVDPAGERCWVFMGANNRYYIGGFQNGRFTPSQSLQTLFYDPYTYAAQSFSDLPDGRIVRIAWNRCAGWSESHFSQQMGIPTAMSLERGGELTYLCARPVSELWSLCSHREVREDLRLAAGIPYKVALEEPRLLFRLEGDFDPETTLCIGCFGQEFDCDMKQNQWHMPQVHGPLSAEQTQLSLTVVIDRCSVEVFADNGKFCYTGADVSHISDPNLPWLTLTADREYTIRRLELCPLDSIWKKHTDA